MTFFQPIWFLLIIPLGVALFLWKLPSRTLLFIRILFWTMLILALADMAIKLPRKNGTVVVVADRSLSMPGNSLDKENETVKIIKKSKGDNDRLAVLSFAEKTTIEKLPDNKNFEGLKAVYDGDRSNLNQALQTAESLIPDGAPGRILLLTDGCWTDSTPDAVFARLAGRGISVDYRILRRSVLNDLAIDSVEAPHRAQPREFFPVKVALKAPKNGTVIYNVIRNNRIIFKGKRKVKTGINRLFFRDKADSPQVLRYTVDVRYEDIEEKSIENNRADFLVKIAGEQPLLLLSMSVNSGLGQVLRKAGINVVVKLPGQCQFSLAELAGYSGIIVENVPANKIGATGMKNIAEWIKNSGSGLMLTGGRNSYGLGGYYRSPLDEILPVSMEMKKEHRKFSLAIVVILDRSGSMSMPASPGKTKMDLANLATAEVFKLLQDYDEFGVIAVDSSPHTIVPLGEKKNLAGASDRILRIASQGGGIFVYTGMVAGLKMLTKARAGTKHIVLFADAADAEEPGDYKRLLAKCSKAGISCSVMALGKKSDQDAKFLMDVAKRGNGQIYFTADAAELPRLFAQDTFVIARNSFVEENTNVKFTAGMHVISSENFGNSFSVGGFNLCFLKPNAEVGAVTTDENSAPLVAFHQVGTGRVLSYTGETDGEFTGGLGKWEKAGDFLAGLARWTTGAQNGANVGESMLFTQSLNNGVHRITLHLDPDRKTDPFKKLPVLNSMTSKIGDAPVSTQLKMQWVDADTMVCEMPLKSTQTNLTTAHVEGFKPLMLAPVKLMYSPEFEPVREKQRKLSIPKLAAMTGGKERINLESIWQDMPVTITTRPIAKWLILAALLLLLVEVLEHRTAVISGYLKRNKVMSEKKDTGKELANSGKSSISMIKRKPKPRPKKQKAESAGKKKAGSKPEDNKEPDQDEEVFSSALRRAKGKTRSK